MGWLISKALMQDFENSRSLPEPVAESLAGTCSDGGQSAQSSSESTPQAYCASDKMTAFSRLSRFGITFAPLTESHGEALLTWYLADSRAKTSALQALALGWMVSGQDSGQRWRGSLAKYDPDSHSLKTAQCSLFEDSTEFCVTLPRSGTMRSGVVYQREKLGPSTSETESGLWPTPTASAMLCEGTVRLCRQRWLDGEATLEEASAIAGRDVRKAQGKVPMWPTPTACMSKGSSEAALTRKDGRDRSSDRPDHAVMASDRGQLNPPWVEWLMGWPQEWTALKPLETDKFQEWQQQHSIFWQDD